MIESRRIQSRLGHKEACFKEISNWSKQQQSTGRHRSLGCWLFSLCSAAQNHAGKFITVVEFVTVKAPKNNKDQQGLERTLQIIQSKALNSSQFQQVSINLLTCFGSRGSGVRIPPPRPVLPLFSMLYLSARIASLLRPVVLWGFYSYKIDYSAGSMRC